MKKKLAAALIGALFAHAAYAFDPFVVRDIRVEGIQRIEAGTVFSYLPIRVGQTMTDEMASEAIRALFGTGFFKDVRIEVEGNVLVVALQERPAVAQIDFSGMKEFPAEDVKLALRENNIAEGRIFDKATIDRAEQEIKRQYLTRGMYGVTIQTTVTPLDRNRVAINFAVDEGEVAKIARINIVGNQAYTEGALLDLFVLRTPGWFTWYTKNDQYSRQKLSADLETLRSFYLDRGYLDFNIESTQVSITPDKQDIYITVNLAEGEKYTVTDVALSGNTIVPEEELRKLIQIKPGEPFSRQRLTDTTKAITDRLGNDGYAFANANAVPEVDRDKRTVAFNIMIDPGRRVYVRRIEVEGNTKTRDEVVRRELRQLEGAYYDGAKLQLSRQRVDRLDYFSEVNVDTEPVAGTTDQVDVTYGVVEKPTGALMFGAGFSSADGVVLQGSISQQNLFGTGNALQLIMNTSKINRNIALSFTNPYLTVDGVSGGFDLYNRRYDPRRRLSFGRYATDTLGGGLRVGVPVTEYDRINFGFAVEQTEIELFDDSPDRFKDFVDSQGDKTLGLLGTVGWTRDRRDSAFWTTSGTYQRAYVEAGLPGADLKYYKLNYELSWYLPLSRDFTLRLKGEGGYASGYGAGELPFFKAFFMGGPNSLRGYEQGSLGPRDEDGVLGGSRKVLGNAEILFPMPGMRHDRSVRMGIFFDAGQVWDSGSGSTLSDLKLRYSTGGFVSWNSPFGPLQLILALPLNEEDGDDTQKFQFMFGQAF